MKSQTASFEESCDKLKENPVIGFSDFLNESISAETASHILLSENLNNSLEKFIGEICGHHQVPVDLQLSVRSHWNISLTGRALFFKKINELLDRGKPIGLEYRSGRVLQRTNEGISADHGSVLLARRWNHKKQVCEFKVRDSIGKNSCDLYQEGIECNGEEGTFWVSDEDLIEMTDRFVWIDSST